MAVYMHPEFLQHANNSSAFDTVFEGGALAPYSGIYRCIHCGQNEVAKGGRSLPPQDHHRHDQEAPIRWRLIVATQ